VIHTGGPAVLTGPATTQDHGSDDSSTVIGGIMIGGVDGGALRQRIKSAAPSAVGGDMTVSIDHLAVPTSREPASGAFPAVRSGVPGAVAALKQGLADGTVHHHGTTPVVAVVRAWAAGGDLEAQRRVCPTCAG
jgi:hypothetical protein